MKVKNHYPTRQKLSEVSIAESYILRAMGDFYRRKTLTTEYVKQDSLPQTIYMSCVKTMYETLKVDPSPTELIDRMWTDLKPNVSELFVKYKEDNPREVVFENYRPNREYERVLLFAGLYALIQADPFADDNLHLLLLEEIAHKASYDETAECYFSPFTELNVAQKVAEEKKKQSEAKEANFYTTAFMESISGMSKEDQYSMLVSEMQRAKADGTYPERYITFLEAWTNAMAKARTRDFKPTEKKEPAANAVIPEGLISMDAIFDSVLESYRDDHKLVDKLEQLISGHYLRNQEFEKLPMLKHKVSVLRSKMPERVQVTVEYKGENFGTQIANKAGGFVVNVSSPEEMEQLQSFLLENKFLIAQNNNQPTDN